MLPGHGTDIADMLPTRWEDWSAAAEEAYTELAARSDGVVVVGLSMGGTLSVWLAEHHPEIAALAVVNPLIVAPDADVVALVSRCSRAARRWRPASGRTSPRRA